MKKGSKGKVVLAQPAVRLPPRPPLSRAPGPIRSAGEEAAYRASLRFQGLLHDLQELAKETEAKKQAVHMKLLKKKKLLADVKFLRKRYKFLSENPSRKLYFRLRDPATPLPSLQAAASADGGHVDGAGSSRRGVLVLKSPSPPIDLNEDCQQNNEMEMEDNHKAWRYSVEGAAAAGTSDGKMSAFLDARNQEVRAGKRKISWQDESALKV